jgi:hypothetical protein
MLKQWCDKEFKKFVCETCQESMANEPNILRSHFRINHPELLESTTTSKAAGVRRARPAATVPAATLPAAAVSIWHCDACDINIPADPASVAAHNASQEHARLRMYAADIARHDGAGLAAATRRKNSDDDAGRMWITVTKKDGSKINKLVQKSSKSGAAAMHAVGPRRDTPADCTRNEFCVCAVCDEFGPLVQQQEKRQKKK